MAYDLIGFTNGNPPAINQTNLNKMDNKIYELDKYVDTGYNVIRNRFFRGENVGSSVTVVTANNTISYFAPILPGKSLWITCKGGTNGRAYYFLNANREILELADAEMQYDNFKITAPENSAYVIVQTNRTIWKIIQDDGAVIYDDLIKSRRNALPFNSRFDKNTSTDGVNAGLFTLRYANGNDSITKMGSGDSAYFKLHFDSASGSNPGVWILDWMPENYCPGNIKISMDVMTPDFILKVYTGNQGNYEIQKCDYWKHLEIIVTPQNYIMPDRRFMLYGENLSGTMDAYVKNLSIEFLDSDVIKVETDGDDNSELTQNILPWDSRFDAKSVVTDGVKLGGWELRYTNNDNSITKVETADDLYYNVALDTTSGSNAALWLLNYLPDSFKGYFRISFMLKSTADLRFLMEQSQNQTTFAASPNGFTKCEYECFVDTFQYADKRIMLFISSGKSVFSIKNMKIDYLDAEKALLETVNNVDAINDKNSLTTWLSATKFGFSKLQRLKTLANSVVNIGFFGDSYTQGTQDNIVANQYESYAKWVCKKLWEEYGFAGLGWLDFGRDGGNGKIFGCSDYYEHWNYSFSGTLSGLDGSDSTQAANCLGICCAHTVFDENAQLSLTFDAGYLDKFILRYYKDAHFTVSVNGGTPVEVTANSTDGWQETEFGTTGTDTTSVVIKSLANGSIIFGMDCFYGSVGVRCHKIGNRGIKLAGYLAMNENQFKTGISKLGLSWLACLMGINDLGGGSTDARCQEIITDYVNMTNRIKSAYNTNSLVTIDLSIIGVANVAHTSYGDLPKLEKYEKKFAEENNYGWASTREVIGTNKAELQATGLYSDELHLNKIGATLFGDYIYRVFFMASGIQETI